MFTSVYDKIPTFGRYHYNLLDIYTKISTTCLTGISHVSVVIYLLTCVCI
jgi:hypothetical protein